ncbi:TraP putative transcriptional regulator [Stutzerimonas stutzeri B1SMN1]|nr:hypothetical protein [uncultured bacterium]EPL60407.1 TraP putative transcriptional regulator [Stutzerimonas stutzeri B1SMN1]CAJ43348.1 TraP putative transcriptional regulator [uncultured bacterium]
MKEAVGRRLTLEASRLGLTGTETAAGIGCSRRTWCYYEAGKSCPDAVALARLDKLGFDVLYVITGRRSEAL